MRLVADVGGTHARFSVLDVDGRPKRVVALRSARFDALGPAVEASLGELGLERAEIAGGEMAVAVAGPLTGDRIELTNAAWSFSLEATRRALGLARLVALNDFEALALALPHLAPDELEVWRRGAPVEEAPRALLGPGTGLGVGALLPSRGGWRALPSEGGHRDLAPVTEREWRATRRIADRRGRLSAEDVLSGPGLAALDSALRSIDGDATAPRTAEEIARGARDGDPAAIEAVCVFSGLLGAVAGDLALTFGARGGVYLAGGVLSGLGATVDRHAFLERFDAKGRMSSYVAEIPVLRVVGEAPALLGAASRLAAPAS